MYLFRPEVVVPAYAIMLAEQLLQPSPRLYWFRMMKMCLNFPDRHAHIRSEQVPALCNKQDSNRARVLQRAAAVVVVAVMVSAVVVVMVVAAVKGSSRSLNRLSSFLYESKRDASPLYIVYSHIFHHSTVAQWLRSISSRSPPSSLLSDASSNLWLSFTFFLPVEIEFTIIGFPTAQVAGPVPRQSNCS